MVLFLLFPVCAKAATVTTNFLDRMPSDIQMLLAQGINWKVQEVSETETNDILLLSGRLVGDKEEIPDQKQYLLLQMPKDNWQATKGNLWTMPAAQGTGYGAVPMLQVLNDTVWLHFWKDEKPVVYCIDAMGVEKSYAFSNLVDASLCEHGAVGYDSSEQAFVLWNGDQKTIYPIKTPLENIRQISELQNKIYYLDSSGNFYQVTKDKTSLRFNVQSLLGNLEEDKRLSYIDSLSLFYCSGKLWFSANDWQWNNCNLFSYDGSDIKTYTLDVPIGTIDSCVKQGDGRIKLMFDAYFPNVPIMMPEPTTIFCIIDRDVAQIARRSGYNWEQPDSYDSRDGQKWFYNMQNSDLLWYQQKQDGSTYGFGMSLPEPTVHVKIDGCEYYFDEMPYVENGRVFVPLRGIATLLGASIQWNDSKVILKKNENTVQLQAGDTCIWINDKPFQIDAPTKNKNGRIMVPLRVISESLEASVDWEQNSQTVRISQ